MMRRVALGLVVGALLGVGYIITVSRTSIQPKSIAQFGGVSLRIELATTTAARERGLGGRTSLTNDEAMLFVFPSDDYYGFWMKDMIVPIDVFWLDDQGQVVWVERNLAPQTYPNVFYPPVPTRYVLETVAGFARAHTIATGTLLQLKNFPSVSK